MKKVIIALGAVAAVGLLAWGFNQMNRSTEPLAPQTPASEEAPVSTETPAEEPETTKVSYDGTGFSPATLTVPAGTTVTYNNDSSRQLWVASDVHPSHNELQEFDQNRSMGQGESYSFTFTETGSWGYHNHLNAGHIGTIIVE